MAKKGKLSRRSFMTRVVGGVGVTSAVFATPAIAQQRTGVNDSDGGANADPAGYGRGNGGPSDSDSGINQDCGGRGRGHRTGNTDSDTGGTADVSGNGRTGRTDSDDSADRAGYGRGRGSCAG